MRRHTGKKPVFLLLLPVYVCLATFFAVLVKRGTVQLLEPAGYIADIQSKILWAALIFAALIGSTIIAAFFFVIFRYKEGKGRQYTPEWTAGKGLQLLGWGVPLAAVIFISIFVWSTAHAVDPYRPLSSAHPPITIQVVALRWKWLFLYPNDRIASVNMLEIPAGVPVNLQLTADAPMNSFWVPRLSGQVYAMTGMVTQLHIEADRPGTYAGSAAEMSGDGFAGMDFTVKAVPATDYTKWKTAAQQSRQTLDYTSYLRLAQPSEYDQPALYTLSDPGLFRDIVMQFMMPGADPSTLSIGGTSL